MSYTIIPLPDRLAMIERSLIPRGSRAVVLFLEPDEEKQVLRITGETEILSAWDALSIYANTPVPCSHICYGNTLGTVRKQLKKLKELTTDPDYYKHFMQFI